MQMQRIARVNHPNANANANASLNAGNEQLFIFLSFDLRLVATFDKFLENLGFLVAPYHHTTCYIQEIRHSAPGRGSRIDTTSVCVTV